MSREAMQMALEALERYGGVDQRACDAEEALRQALETEKQEPVANEVQLDIIRYWPDDFAVRLESMWKDLIGFIPNYKLYDLQKMLAEFGFTMVLYEGNRPQAREWVGLTDEEVSYCRYAATFCDELDTAYMAELIEQALKEKNHG